jgi:hypothetical protein
MPGDARLFKACAFFVMLGEKVNSGPMVAARRSKRSWRSRASK